MKLLDVKLFFQGGGGVQTNQRQIQAQMIQRQVQGHMDLLEKAGWKKASAIKIS